MKILASNLKKGFVKLKIDNSEDLWYLSNIIQEGDTIKGSTVRKIKVGGEEKSESFKKRIFISLNTEKIEFSQSADALRITGTITEAPEEISRGSHHTLQVEINDTIVIEKQKWLSYQIEKLREASETKTPLILLCIFDREEAFFAQMARQGYKTLAHIKGDVAKKRTEHRPTGDFYKQIIEKIKEYDQRMQAEKIILASPSFWKEELLKILGSDALRNKLILATCSSADENAFNEVLKREETQEALRQDRTAQEIKIVDQILLEIGKEGKAAYGLSQVGDATNAGAVRILAITDGIIKDAREQNKYFVLDKIMRATDLAKGEIKIIHSENSAGKKLDGIGGIAALLRYKI